MASENGLNNEYVAVLARFPKETFSTNNTYEQFEAFDDVLEMASQGAFEHINSNSNADVDKKETTDIKNQPQPSQKKKATNSSYFIYVIVAEVVIIIGGIAYFIYRKNIVIKKR